MGEYFYSSRLGNENRCQTLRNFDFKMVAPESDTRNLTIGAKTLISNAIQHGWTRSGIKSAIMELFREVEYPMPMTKLVKENEMYCSILRYLSYVSTKKEIFVYPDPAVIYVDGKKIKVTSPDGVFIRAKKINGVPVITRVNVVKYMYRKPNLTINGKSRDEAITTMPEIFTLWKYATTFVPYDSKEDVEIIASYVFLKDKEDKAEENIKVSQLDIEDGVDIDLDKVGGRFISSYDEQNIISISGTMTHENHECRFTTGEIFDKNTDERCKNCMYRETCKYNSIGNNMESITEISFLKTMQDALEGEERCSEEDCKYCQMNNICNYKRAPKVLDEEMTLVSKPASEIKLSDAQKKGAEISNGIYRIDAGAGTGKTVLVIFHILWLLMQGVEPEHICAITFTVTGADEMKARLASYCKDLGVKADVDAVTICTFNAFGDKIIKNEYAKLGFSYEPTLIDDVQRNAIIASMLDVHPVSGLRYANFKMKQRTFLGALPFCSKAFECIKRNRLNIGDEGKLIDAVGAPFNKTSIEGQTAWTELLKMYFEIDEILKSENLIEYADQEMMVLDILDNNKAYFEKFQYEHIIVDEMQDTSATQMLIIKALVETSFFKSLIVVGDDDQSIFGFRGTSPEHIIDFYDELGHTGEDIFLVENHRSTPEILCLANKIAGKNQKRVMKDLVSTRESGKKPVVNGFLHKQDEYQYISDKIVNLIGEGYKPQDIAFIAGTKSELVAMADILTKKNVPAIILTPEPYMQNSRVLAALDVIKFIIDPNATKSALVWINALHKGELLSLPKAQVEQELQERMAFIETFDKLSTEEEKGTAIINELLLLDDEDEIYQKFVEMLSHFRQATRICEYCLDFERYGEDVAIRRQRKYPGVVLTTAHSSKGLEWPVVFVTLDKFDDKSIRSKAAIEEKRRLVFVSITRARDEVYITGTYSAYLDSQTKDMVYNRYLQECYEANGQTFSPSEIEIMFATEKKEKADRKKFGQ